MGWTLIFHSTTLNSVIQNMQLGLNDETIYVLGFSIHSPKITSSIKPFQKFFQGVGDFIFFSIGKPSKNLMETIYFTYPKGGGAKLS